MISVAHQRQIEGIPASNSKLVGRWVGGWVGGGVPITVSPLSGKDILQITCYGISPGGPSPSNNRPEVYFTMKYAVSMFTNIPSP